MEGSQNVYVINFTLRGVKGASLGIVGGQLYSGLNSRLMSIRHKYTLGATDNEIL